MIVLTSAWNAEPVRTVAIVATLIFTTLAPSFSAAAAIGSEGSRSGDFTLYVGLEIVTDVQGKRYPVIAGSDTEIRVRKDGETLKLPRPQAPLKAAMEPRLSRAQVAIDDLRGERGYSPAADPAREAMARDMFMQAAESQAQSAADRTARIAVEVAKAKQSAGGLPESEVAEAQFAAANALIAQNRAYTAPAFVSALAGTINDPGTYDAFSVKFRISASESQHEAYGVLRLQVRNPENPQQAGQVLKFFDLRGIGPKPREINVVQKGLPAGFSVDTYDVHVYVDGKEIATNLSKNRIEVTADEAHQFLILRHQQLNGNASIPAESIAELRPAELHALIGRKLMAATVDLAIDRDNRVTKIFSLAGLSAAPDERLVAALRGARFLPALVNGQPVDSRGTFALSELKP